MTENLTDTFERLTEICFKEQHTFADFEEFKAEIDEQIYLYKTYIDEINKVFGGINNKVSMNQEKQRFEVMKKMQEIEYKYTALLIDLGIYKKISTYMPSSHITGYIRNLIGNLLTKK